ncbi:MAG: hypothetical protein Q7K55_08665 [Candidatus Levybacteria bacterium]|nr:hypothetical protein [Candidatus Levybacteria bacterium]
MGNLKLDSVLILSLVIPFIMKYGLGTRETPYFIFGVIFLGLLFYIIIDLLNIKIYLYHKIKNLLLWGLIILVIGSAFASAIITRHRTHPVDAIIHDMPLQQEIAVRFLMEGKNPYGVNYFGTFLEQWHYSEKDVNPALYHFVLPPFYILFAVPFYFAGNFIFGFFDARMPLLALFLLMLIVAAIAVKDQDKKRLFLILLSFNPAMLPYMLEGRSDIFMFSFLFLGFYLLHTKKYIAAGFPMALAFAVKQSAWPILPFYLVFLLFKNSSIKKTVLATLPFIATLAIIIVPFFLWNQKSFLDSIIFYLSGSTEYSYPISGYGLGQLLKSFGLIKDVYSYYPFYIWQIIFCAPLGVLLIKYFSKNRNVKTLILTYGIFLFVFWYLSRYFNNSHLGYLSLVFITAYFFPEDKTET